MTIYLTFPVAMFWIANQAEWFEDYVIQRKVGTGSFQGVGEGRGHQSAGHQCLPPLSRPGPGVGLWRLLACGSNCVVVPTEGAVAPREGGPGKRHILLSARGQRGLAPHCHDGTESGGTCGFLTALSLKVEPNPT